MPRFIRRTPVALLVVLTGVLAGCSSPKPAFEKEDFAQSDTYSPDCSAGSAAACDAGRRALLSQGYNIDRFESARVTGHKNFQAEDGQHTQISFNIECAADSGSNERATVFANAVQDRYSIKRTANSASVGVSVLGQVSMPFGASDDSLVKTAKPGVSRPQFYDGFSNCCSASCRMRRPPPRPSRRPRGRMRRQHNRRRPSPPCRLTRPIPEPGRRRQPRRRGQDAPVDAEEPPAGSRRRPRAGGHPPTPGPAPPSRRRLPPPRRRPRRHPGSRSLNLAS